MTARLTLKIMDALEDYLPMRLNIFDITRDWKQTIIIHILARKEDACMMQTKKLGIAQEEATM